MATDLGPEIVIGLVAPIGTDLQGVTLAVKSSLTAVGYISIPVKVSRVMCKYRGVEYPAKPADERYDELMTLGTEIRKELGRGDALALLAALEVREERKKITGNPSVPAPRRAYVVDSLKNPAEAETLRAIYGDAFFLLAAYAPRAARVQRLASLIAESRHGVRPDEHRARAEELLARDDLERDEFNRGMLLGQNVQDVFPLADAFIDGSSPQAITHSVSRAINLLFAYPFHSPTRDEQGMFFAKAAALRSSSLARQVGAAITNAEGDIKCTGTNEVPKTGGGLYWEGDEPDDRDFRLGRDVSDEHKRRLVADILRNLIDAGWLSSARSAENLDILVNAALETKPVKGPLRKARIMDVLEYVRAVHAEMAAITDASRRGISLAGDTMYVTTFPCHECARLIVASGIRRVVYIEPYPKSLAAELYPSSVQVESDSCEDKVQFEPFIGVAPRRYMELFEMQAEKKDKTGRIVAWVPAWAQPRIAKRPPVHPQTEHDYGLMLQAAIQRSRTQTTLDI